MPDFVFTHKDGRTVTITGPEGSTREQAFQKLQEQLKANPDLKGDPTSVPIGGYVGQTLKGAAQAGASALSTGLDVAEGIGKYGGGFAPQPFGGAAGIASIIPKDWRKSIEDFANEPYTPGYETAGRIGYWGATLAPGAVGAVKGGPAAVQGVRAAAANPLVREVVKDAAIAGGTELGLHMVGGIPGVGGLGAVAARHFGPKLLRKLLSKAGEAAEGAAEKPPPMPKAPAQPPPATAKPRIRVKAQTREAKPDERPAIED